MTLQQLKYFIKIAECGSISEAASQLFMSQPSLSYSLKQLEDEFGANFFNRSTRMITLTPKGEEFLAYARDIVDRQYRLYERFKEEVPAKRQLSVSTHHYAFAVTAFANVIKGLSAEQYDLTLRESGTYEILEDIATLKSEIGIIFLSEFNRKPLERYINDFNLSYHPIFKAPAHVFISKRHPMSGESSLTLEDLKDFPFLAFEQGRYNAFYFSEEILSEVPKRKVIYVRDRATLFNLLEMLDGYTFSTGILNNDLNGEDIVAIPLKPGQDMEIGYLSNKKASLSFEAQDYVKELKRLIALYGYKLIKEQ